MTQQLSQKELDGLQVLEKHFTRQAEYVKTVLSKKFFPDQAKEEIEYLVKENTALQSRQDEWICRNFHILNEIWERLHKNV